MNGKVCAVRGATTAENTPEGIKESTKELLLEICKQNNIDTDDQLISVFFTSTSDLTAEFPAKAARFLGWTRVPLLCARELEIEGSLPSCIRVLIHFYSLEHSYEIKHVYLKEARNLRPDLEYSG